MCHYNLSIINFIFQKSTEKCQAIFHLSIIISSIISEVIYKISASYLPTPCNAGGGFGFYLAIFLRTKTVPFRGN